MSEAIDLFVDRPAPSAPYPLNRTADKLHRAGRIEITHLSKSYGAFKALDDVSLTIEPGTVTVILGLPDRENRPCYAPSIISNGWTKGLFR